MGIPVWALALLILIPLVQVPAVLYLGRYTRLREGETPGRDDWEYGHHPGTSGTAEREAGLCDACGAKNDPEFRFCRDCATRIGVPGR